MNIAITAPPMTAAEPKVSCGRFGVEFGSVVGCCVGELAADNVVEGENELLSAEGVVGFWVGRGFGVDEVAGELVGPESDGKYCLFTVVKRPGTNQAKGLPPTA